MRRPASVLVTIEALTLNSQGAAALRFMAQASSPTNLHVASTGHVLIRRRN